MQDIQISVQKLEKTYGNQGVLNGVTFEVNRGSIFALLGENGAGKTTTVNILSTLIKADSGQVTIAGLDMAKDAETIRSLISLTAQDAAVDELLTGEENLEMMGRLYHLNRKEVRAKATQLLQKFNLEEAANKPVKTYSGGMRRKLDIAISLLASPKVLFLDEPTTGLDPRSRLTMWQLIKELAQSGMTIFLTTQYLEEADQLADKIALIHQGKIVAQGTANQLKEIVGQETIVLSFDDVAALDKAQAFIQGVADAEELSISIATDGSTNSLRELLNRLHRHDLEPSSVQFRKPTLDDVFMEITAQRKGAEAR